MRALPLIAALGAAVFAAGVSESQAAPINFSHVAGTAPASVIAVQLRCDRFRCIDPRNGAYTQSGCDYRGCYPISGVVGYANPETLSGSSYPPRRYHEHRRYYGD